MTDNPAHSGTYQIQLEIYVDGPSSVGTKTVIYTIEISRCKLDQLSQTQISDITYYFGQGPMVVDSGVTHQFPECEVTLVLTMVNGQPYDPEIFSVDQEDRSFTIETEDTDLDNQSLDMILTIESEFGTIADSFKVKFADGCSGATLVGAKFLLSEVDLYLYKEEVFFFTKPELNTPI